ncbi:MAG: aminopeptidase P family protein [Pseudomonadota bacterium]
MFQSFVSPSDSSKGPARLERLRAQMKAAGVTAFLVPHADEHQNEYLPERAERLAWLTGFTGSAGFAIITHEDAVVFVDGRYTLQAREQISADAFTSDSLIENPPAQWLETNLGKNDKVAYDPWLITVNQLKTYEKAAEKAGFSLIATDNLIDQVWDDQPPAPVKPVKVHPVDLAGKAAKDKISEIQSLISEKDCDYTILTDPASLCWLFNIRGSDMVHNPLPLGFAIVPAEGKPRIFMERAKLDAEVEAYLSELADIKQPDTLLETIATLAKDKTFLCDGNLTATAIADTIKQADGKIVNERDPVVLPRAIKNEVEQQGARNAHLRDGVAICKFLCWLDGQETASLDEIIIAQKLEQFRADNAKAMNSELVEISFDTISGSGPNGAIVHYRVNENTNRQLESGELYLCDSGGQYVDGTTDITRTVAIGPPPAEAIKDFTLVLKGHIAISLARFPKGTRGIDLDVLARIALWQNGKDYAHGTGHGIGSYLNVHEGPQGIHRRSMEPLVPGMIVSNEPGFYVEGSHGIRIENLEMVTPLEDTGGNIKTHAFETLTLAPIDLRLIDVALLTEAEVQWLNAYHARVFEEVSPHLSEVEKDWLGRVTRSV